LTVFLDWHLEGVLPQKVNGFYRNGKLAPWGSATAIHIHCLQGSQE